MEVKTRRIIIPRDRATENESVHCASLSRELFRPERREKLTGEERAGKKVENGREQYGVVSRGVFRSHSSRRV